MKIIWYQGSGNPENLQNFATIHQWWTNLHGQEITWKQRIIDPNIEVDQLDWEQKRFDEVFAIANSEIRGITLYWCKPDSPQERNTTPQKLILDTHQQDLYIFPQSQKELVIRVGVPSIHYQTISLTNPDYSFHTVGNHYILTLQDATQQLQVKVTLNSENLKQLLRQLTR